MRGKRLEKVAGAFIVDGQQTAETLQCCHCGMHWARRPGSGTSRGFCLKCYSVICGQPACMNECKPFEQWLEEVEAVGKLNVEKLEQTAEGIYIARS
jgi:hypothetical protein